MDNISKIACCNICTLASAMKDCKTYPFNPGNLGKLSPAELATITRPELKPIDTLSTSNHPIN